MHIIMTDMEIENRVEPPGEPKIVKKRIRVAKDDKEGKAKAVRAKRAKTTGAACLDPFVPPAVIPEEIRSRCRQYLTRCLENKGAESGDVYASQLEAAIHLGSKEDLTAYRHKAYAMSFNLAKNGEFLVARYTPSLLVTLDESLLAEGTDVAQRKAQHEKRMTRLQQILSDQDEKDKEDEGPAFMICTKCKDPAFRPHWRARQVRSPDEPAHIFCNCTNPVCGHRWTMK